MLFIALTAEERGLLGSDYFAHYPTVPSDAIVANVNLDMPLFLYPVADIIAFGSEHSSLESTVANAIVAEGFTLTPDPMPEENLFRRSDQYSFVRRGVPAAFLKPGFTSTDASIDGKAVENEHRKNHYHQPSDDLGRPVDWDSAVRFARANARIGYAIANDDERPTWNEGDFFGEMFAR
jgi:Zn-dependent M28 family amino/carboxypeptidase